MDRSLNLSMNLDPFTSWEISKNLIDTAQKCNGVITLLWHNNDLIGNQRKLYEKILKYCAEGNAWMTNGAEIVLWWGQHGKD
jgi:peptidoglycan/xylan/chitin deacetylase (PgdA/CDA1 family)